MILTSHAIVSLQGEMRPPSDKSLTHRAYMLAAIANGNSVVKDPLRGEDCEATLRCLNHLGLRHEWASATEVRLIPARDWTEPKAVLDCGNSGTTMRLLSGLVASRPITCTLTGDASLRRRPMQRIGAPLRLMGAKVEGDKPPLTIAGGPLTGIRYESPVASAQVKSCILLAGLRANGRTTVIEPVASRDHTERMLTALGVELDYPILDTGYAVSLQGGQQPRGFEFSVPGDISSAAFMMVAAAVLPDGDLTIHNLSMNPSRTGILDVFRQCGIRLLRSGERNELGEPVADIRVKAPPRLRPFQIDGDLVPRLIDEIPVLAVLATQCEGVTSIRGAAELRVKESDRIEMMANGLRAMGANIETQEDGLTISGPTALTAASIDATGDHRVAMAFAVAGLLAAGETQIAGAESIATSYPNFEQDLMRLSLV